MKPGRPAFYDSAEEMQSLIDSYFQSTPSQEQTITGLALHLGFESRQSFYAYEDKGEFSYTLKKARLRIEQSYESLLKVPGSGGGPIFALKNFGWKDKTEVDQNVTLGIAPITLDFGQVEEDKGN